ncbi:MAG: ABC transporter permease subunit/CPBP intramembrane protease [Phycisphaerae bacterium]|jgi:ABC-2 type transport system permease protein/sodium transport system permease protein
MNRFSRISTVWRKEFADTLRDRRTLVAMVLVPMVLYPALMLGSLQAFELQVGRLKQEEYTVAVGSPDIAHWLRTRIIDPDPARHPAAIGRAAEDVPAAIEAATESQPSDVTSPQHEGSAAETAQADVRHRPPPYRVEVFPDVPQAVIDGRAHSGVIVVGDRLPRPDSPFSTHIMLVVDQTEIRSQIATAGLEGIFQRANDRIVERRLADENKTLDFIQPLRLEASDVASPEKLGGSVLGQIVPLILIIMTITGAIYPAIDLTAGERERGTLETLMAAPVPTVDLIAGKFVVVASIGMLSAILNLLSIGGTIYLGGLGNVLTGGGHVTIPLRTLPLVLLVLIPLAVMFSAMLLAVCSFARSFKEAQNYVMPVMMVALIPAVIGVLPGTELKGPLLILPVTNIVILTRELFMGQIDRVAILWVSLSTCVYAAAAVAVAAKLFGQEAVLFADSASIRTLFKRKFFRPRNVPTAAQAMLLVAVVYSLNFFVQQSMLKSGLVPGSVEHLAGLALTLAILFAALPIATAAYLRVRITSALSLGLPRPGAWLAALCFGLGTWVLALAWLSVQQRFLPLPAEFEEAARPLEEQLRQLSLIGTIFFAGIVPAFCEELFFRGFALSGLRAALGRVGAVLVVAFAFGATHYSVHRLAVTAALGVLFGMLVVQWGSIWPAMLAHMMHNCMVVLMARDDGLLPWLQKVGFFQEGSESVMPPAIWLGGAAALVTVGILLSIFASRPRPAAGQ